MALLDVREVYVVQDRATGAFVDENMGFVQSLKWAVRAESIQSVHESMGCAILDSYLDCQDGYEVHMIYELID